MTGRDAGNLHVGVRGRRRPDAEHLPLLVARRVIVGDRPSGGLAFQGLVDRRRDQQRAADRGVVGGDAGEGTLAQRRGGDRERRECRRVQVVRVAGAIEVAVPQVDLGARRREDQLEVPGAVVGGGPVTCLVRVGRRVADEPEGAAARREDLSVDADLEVVLLVGQRDGLPVHDHVVPVVPAAHERRGRVGNGSLEPGVVEHRAAVPLPDHHRGAAGAGRVGVEREPHLVGRARQRAPGVPLPSHVAVEKPELEAGSRRRDDPEPGVGRTQRGQAARDVDELAAGGVGIGEPGHGRSGVECSGKRHRDNRREQGKPTYRCQCFHQSLLLNSALNQSVSVEASPKYFSLPATRSRTQHRTGPPTSSASRGSSQTRTRNDRDCRAARGNGVEDASLRTSRLDTEAVWESAFTAGTPRVMAFQMRCRLRIGSSSRSSFQLLRPSIISHRQEIVRTA